MKQALFDAQIWQQQNAANGWVQDVQPPAVNDNKYGVWPDIPPAAQQFTRINLITRLQYNEPSLQDGLPPELNIQDDPLGCLR